MATTKKGGNPQNEVSPGRNEATKKKVHKHLVDINDVITEQDISNVSTEDSASYDKLNKEDKKIVKKEVNKVTRDVKKKHKDDKTDGNNTPDIDTPWNVLG